MSKLKIEHGASKTKWVLLKTNIEEPISQDIDRLCEWSNNERKYVVNELLRFGLAQSEDFQKHKAGSEEKPSKAANASNSVPTPLRATGDSAMKSRVAVASPADRP